MSAITPAAGEHLLVEGDHEPVTAVGDVCAAVACDAILLCTRHRRLSHAHPLDLAHRIDAA